MAMLKRGTMHGVAGAVVIFAMLASGWGLSAFAADAKQRTFASTGDAVTALIEAAKSGDKPALLAILGRDGKALISSGDETADRLARERFVQSYQDANQLTMVSDAKATLSVGKDDWPFPIPLVKGAAGKRDGLYWEAKPGEEPSPLGPLVATARRAGYSAGKPGGGPIPYHGYYYRILTAQGKDAPGGAYDYLARGHMIGGFALVAYPAQYASSGVMTFIVNHDGVMYQKDLGPDTSAIAQAMTRFNPDASWKKVDGGSGA